MRSKALKLFILLAVGLMFFACKKDPLMRLPDPIVSNDADSGWKNY